MKQDETLDSILSILNEARNEERSDQYSLEEAHNLISHSYSNSTFLDENEKILIEIQLQFVQENLPSLWEELFLGFPEQTEENQSEAERNQLYDLIRLDNKISAYFINSSLRVQEFI